MMSAEFSNEDATDCLVAAKRILQRNGIPNQNGEITFGYRDLLFARTNGNEVEIRYVQHTVLRVPPPEGSGRPFIWQPGVWIEQLGEIDW